MKAGHFPSPPEIPDHQQLVRRWARDLTGSEHDADDAAQDVWVEALRQRERGFTRFSGWMRAVTGTAVAQIVRRDRSRLGRERLVARPEQQPSFLEELERRSVLDSLVRAIQRLREPYRQVVRLRYLEELGLDEIASRLDRPPSTVRGQLKRGLDELRTRLERREPESVFWGAALLGWWTAGPPRRIALKSIGTLALVAVPVLVVTTPWREAPRPAATTLARAEAPAPLALAAAAPATPAREAILASSPPAPAAPSSGAAGGIALSGRVVTALGAAVPGAAIQVLSAKPDAPVRIAGYADAQGEFSLSGIDPKSWIGAHSAGLEPSALHPLEWLAKDDVELVLVDLQPGRVTLVVRDAEGRPVVGAEVEEVFGLSDVPFLGVRLIPERHPRGVRARTDDAGRLMLSKYRSRRPYLLVHSEGRAPWFARQELASELDETLTVVLPRAARISGRALLPDGAAARGLAVTFECAAPLTSIETRTDDAGRFELEGLPPTRYTLRVHDETGRLAPSSVVCGDIAAGALEQLELRLSHSATLQGRAVDAAGEPLADWTVALEPARASNARGAQLGTPIAVENPLRRTDALGRFAFGGLSDERHHLWLYPPDGEQLVPHASLRGVRPGGPELSLATKLYTDPSAYVSGRVLGQRATGDTLRLRLLSRRLETPYPLTLLADGIFEGGPLPPGQYELEAHTRSLGAWKVERFIVGPDEELALTPFTPPSTGSLHLVIRGALPAEPPALILVSDSFLLMRQLREGVDFDGREAVVEPLPPGQYNLLVRTTGFCDQYRNVTIASGSEATHEIRLRPGAMRLFRIRSPAPLSEHSVPSVVLTHPDGSLQRFSMPQPTWRDPNTLTFGLGLAPGDYEIEVSFRGSLAGELAFTIDNLASGESPTETLEIVLAESP